ncbi:MAG: CDP-diacylglycerol--serine O-phosphatidyltransferase [Calditrichaeota bacterium]|nr:CDP-diacylglycerol--serine O-phosphatidyltransferase [Calditrichota bacterium]
MRFERAILPNFITFANLFLGYWAIMLISQGRFTSGAWLIVAAAILDGIDGAVARLIKSSSRFGAEMDSLADVVSFGVAPSLLVYHLLFQSVDGYSLIFAFMLLAAGAARLARYNLIHQAHPDFRGFIGMPIPCGALIIVGFYLYSHHNPEGLSTLPIWFALVPLVATLEISLFEYRRIPLFAIPSAKHPFHTIALIGTIAACFIFKPEKVLFPVMTIYLFTGPAGWLAELLRKEQPIEDDTKDGTPTPYHGRPFRRRNR